MTALPSLSHISVVVEHNTKFNRVKELMLISLIIVFNPWIFHRRIGPEPAHSLVWPRTWSEILSIASHRDGHWSLCVHVACVLHVKWHILMNHIRSHYSSWYDNKMLPCVWFVDYRLPRRLRAEQSRLWHCKGSIVFSWADERAA